jgi:SagB-type dehydrogenase family enzyme
MNPTELRALFHENTKNFESIQWYGHDDYPDSWTSVEYKRFPRGESVDIETPSLGNAQRLQDVLARRESPDRFDSGTLTTDDVYGILHGVRETHSDNGMSLRAYPSGGARYSPELYLSIKGIEGFKQGVYHVTLADDQLTRVLDEPLQDEMASMAVTEQPAKSPLIVIVTAILERTEEKYGIRGYRYAHLCAGHLVQNMLLCATALGFGGRPWGDFHESKLDDQLPLEESERTIYTALFGGSGSV